MAKKKEETKEKLHILIRSRKGDREIGEEQFQSEVLKLIDSESEKELREDLERIRDGWIISYNNYTFKKIEK